MGGKGRARTIPKQLLCHHWPSFVPRIPVAPADVVAVEHTRLVGDGTGTASGIDMASAENVALEVAHNIRAGLER